MLLHVPTLASLCQFNPQLPFLYALRSFRVLTIQLPDVFFQRSQSQLVEQIRKLEIEVLSRRKEVKQLKVAVFSEDAPLFKVFTVSNDKSFSRVKLQTCTYSVFSVRQSVCEPRVSGQSPEETPQ